MILLFGKFRRDGGSIHGYVSDSYEIHGGKTRLDDRLEASVGLPVMFSGEAIGRIQITLESGRFKAKFNGPCPSKNICVIVYRHGGQRFLRLSSATASALQLETPA